MTDKKKLAIAFQALRRTGIAARMNFSCCGSCGSYELANRFTNDDARGYIFYHKQEGARVRGERLPDGGLYLHWAARTTDTEMNIASDIVMALNTAGLHAEMPKDISACIHVKGASQ